MKRTKDFHFPSGWKRRYATLYMSVIVAPNHRRNRLLHPKMLDSVLNNNWNISAFYREQKNCARVTYVYSHLIEQGLLSVISANASHPVNVTACKPLSARSLSSV